MKITLEAYKKKTTIETENDDLVMDEVVRELVVPVLIGAGYQKGSIDVYIQNYE